MPDWRGTTSIGCRSVISTHLRGRSAFHLLKVPRMSIRSSAPSTGPAPSLARTAPESSTLVEVTLSTVPASHFGPRELLGRSSTGQPPGQRTAHGRATDQTRHADVLSPPLHLQDRGKAWPGVVGVVLPSRENRSSCIRRRRRSSPCGPVTGSVCWCPAPSWPRHGGGVPGLAPTTALSRAAFLPSD
jgi:hypothetical protein